jgi:hypothetical protein
MTARRITAAAGAFALAWAVACIPSALTVQGDASPSGADGAVLPDTSSGLTDSSMTPIDGATPRDASMTDAGVTTDGPVDSATAETGPVFSPGTLRCAMTDSGCDLEGGLECCLTMFGTGNGAVLAVTLVTSACEAIGGPNCGSLVQIGTMFTMNFPQTCASATDCPVGEACCLAVADGGSPAMISGVGCQPAQQCTLPWRTICRTDTDCPVSMHCTAETDPVLSSLYAKDCQ